MGGFRRTKNINKLVYLSLCHEVTKGDRRRKRVLSAARLQGETNKIVGISALTDIVDGFIARKFNMASDFGKALDPIADKLTQGIVLLCVASRFPYLLILAALLLIKEVVTGAVNLHVVCTLRSAESTVS